MEKIKDDDPMDEYMCACINLYMKNNKINDESFIKTCRFVGITRKNPYNFQLLDDEILSKYKKKYKTKKMIEDAESFLNKVKTKSIFNGALIRDTTWGALSEPINLRVRGNRYEFDTYYKVPFKIVQQLALSNPDVTFLYTFIEGNKVNKVSFKESRVRYEIKTELDEVNFIDEIRRNVCI